MQMGRISYALAVVRLGRPHFLAGGIILYSLGAAVARYQGGQTHLRALLWGQAAITAVQWMTHYGNDYFDLDGDQANDTPTRWSGGSRVLVQGLVGPRVALLAALLLGGLALGAMLALSLAVRTGPLTLPTLLLALLLAWSYSGPPLRLHSSGAGEVIASLLVAGLTPLTGYYLQTGRLDALPVVAVAPLVCLQFAMLLAVEYPDAVADAAAGKRTLVVRLGAARVARLHVTVLVAAYAVLSPAVALGLPLPVALAVLPGAPLAGWLTWHLLRGAWHLPERWNSLATGSVALLAGTAAVESAAFLWLAAA